MTTFLRLRTLLIAVIGVGSTKRSIVIVIWISVISVWTIVTNWWITLVRFIVISSLRPTTTPTVIPRMVRRSSSAVVSSLSNMGIGIWASVSVLIISVIVSRKPLVPVLPPINTFDRVSPFIVIIPTIKRFPYFGLRLGPGPRVRLMRHIGIVCGVLIIPTIPPIHSFARVPLFAVIISTIKRFVYLGLRLRPRLGVPWIRQTIHQIEI